MFRTAASLTGPLLLAAFAAAGAQTLRALPVPATADSAADAGAAVPDSLKTTAAADDTVSYQADRIRFRGERFSLAGSALLKYRGSLLRADSIVYHADHDVVEAFGVPEIEDPGNPSIQGYRMRYNLRNKVGTVYYGSSEKDGQTFHGHEVRRQPDGGVYIARGDFSTCDDPTHSHYYFYARRMIVRPEARVLSGPVVMNIAEVPVAVLPMMLMPLGKGRRSGLLQPKFGGDQSQGFYVQNMGYYWAFNDYHDLTLAADVVEGASGTFDQTHLNGTYQWNKRYVWSGMVGGKLYVPQFRMDRAGGYVDFRNDLNITPDGRQTLKGSGRLQSDPAIVDRNAFTEQDRLQQTANANLGYRRQFDRAGAVLNVEAAQDYNLTQNHLNRSLPNVTFSASGPLVPFSEGSRPGSEDARYRNWDWTYSNHFNVNQISRPAAGASPGDSTVYVGYADRAALTGKYTAFNYLNLTPALNASQLWSAGARANDPTRGYENAFDPANGEYGQHFLARNAGVRADTRLYGIAQASDDPWFGRVTAVRHTVSPAVDFRYAPELDSNPRLYANPRIGGSAYQAEQRTVGFSPGNDVDFKTRAPGDSSGKKDLARKLLAANSTIDYNFAADRRPRSQLSSHLNLYLFPNLPLTLNATHAVYDDFAADSAARDRATSPILSQWSFGFRRGLEVGGGFSTGLRLRDTEGLSTGEFEHAAWSASLNYNAAINSRRVGTRGGGNPVGRFFGGVPFLGDSEVFETSRTHQATAGLRLSPTKSWKMTYDTEFNFTEGEFSRHALGFERILHCWQMNFTWTPVGVSPGWYFVIRIIDLPDVKLETRDSRALRR